MFLKNKNIIFKIRRSQVTDYAALKRQSRLQQTTNFETSYPIFEKNKVCYFMTILMKYHALFGIFEKAAKFEIVVSCKL